MNMYMRYKLGIDKSNCVSENYLTLPYLILPYLTLPYLTLPCKTARIFRTEYRLNYMKHILCDSA